MMTNEEHYTEIIQYHTHIRKMHIINHAYYLNAMGDRSSSCILSTNSNDKKECNCGSATTPYNIILKESVITTIQVACCVSCAISTCKVIYETRPSIRSACEREISSATRFTFDKRANRICPLCLNSNNMGLAELLSRSRWAMIGVCIKCYAMARSANCEVYWLIKCIYSMHLVLELFPSCAMIATSI